MSMPWNGCFLQRRLHLDIESRMSLDFNRTIRRRCLFETRNKLMFNNGLDVGGHSKASKAGNGGKLSAEVLTLLETSFCAIEVDPEFRTSH